MESRLQGSVCTSYMIAEKVVIIDSYDFYAFYEVLRYKVQYFCP